VAIETATLLEREHELTVLRDALSGAREGRGQVVLVEAPAGLGKTSLLKAAAETAEGAGFACLRARANELEHDFAYGCVRQLLEPLLAKVADHERDRLFEGAAALSRPLFAPTGTPQPSPSADSSLAMLHGLYWLLNNLSDEGPLALFVDDLQWSDTESLRFLNYLAPRLDGLPLGVLASTRSGDSVTPELARLAAGPETTVLRPGPLSAEATVALCERVLGTDVAPEFAAACREATGGNPFFLEELLREAREQKLSADSREAARVEAIGPAAIARAVVLRLSEAPAAASALVRAVAVLGDGASLAEAARLAEVSDEEAGSAADLLAALAILKPATGLEFAHPIVREAVYADLGSHARAEAHARAAEILVASGASEERIAAQIAEAEPAGDPGRVELLRRVAADALARGGPAAGVAWLRRALAEPPPPESTGEVLLELSSARLRLGTPEAAIEELTEAGELIRDPGLLTTATRLLGGALTWSGDADRAVGAFGPVIESVESQDRELTLLLEADRAAYAQQASLDARIPVVGHLERHGPLAGDTPGERLVLASLAFERARASKSERDAVAFVDRALANGRLLSEQELDVAGTLYLLVTGLLATDALDLVDACLERMLADAQARASIPAQAFVLVHRGWASLRRGDVSRAESDARTALELLTTHDIRLGTRFALGLLVEALIEGGELDAAEEALRRSGLGEEIPPGMANNDLLEARGLLHTAQGRTRKGLEDLVEYGRRDELWGAANPLASRWRSRASLALGALGDSEPAHAMAAEDLARARRWGAASGIGVALRTTALLEGGSASVERLREAVETLERSPARLEHARALVDLGAALRRANRRAEARSVLEDGRDFAERCRARALVSRARTELRVAGGRTSDPYGTGVELLTASERRVAELAAEGQSNPEIAQALFVTRKTIETHLGSVYRKLQISGRGKLAAALAAQVSTAGES
jgi:DNA-binding CsgD family transcriptional regulator